MARSCSTSGRLASLSEPLMAMVRSAHFSSSINRVAGSVHGERGWRAGNGRRGNESIDRPDNLAHARRGTLGEIRQELRSGLVLGCREIAGVEAFPQRAIGRLHLDDETALEA